MDSKKIIKKYIMPNFFVRAGAILLALVCAATLVMGLLALNAETPDPVEFFPSETPTGTMAYIDVVGVSNWLYQYDSAVYYSVEDAEGYLYTVRLNDRQLKEMAAQEEYWNRETETAPMPEAYRLVGYVQKTGNDVRESLAQSWDITEAEYEQHFGVNFLNATTSAGAENSVIWFIGALFSGLFSLLFFVLLARAASMSKKCLAILEDRCLLEKAAQQLQNKEAQLVIGKNRGILTQDFIFGKGTGAVLAYEDIVWAYKQDAKRYFMEVNSYLMAGTVWMNAQNIVDLNAPDKTGCIGDALAVIGRRNPNVLLGFTKENRKAYKAAVKAAK
jgi:hypothetical protein